jgi:DNA-binding CsgD family transcriptional regulator
MFDQVRHEPLAQLGLAALALDRGEDGMALDLAQKCLRRLPVDDRLERMPALEMFIRACVASGDCEGAREVLPELEEMRSKLATRPVQASVQIALGLLAFAEERFEAARAHLEDAVDLYEQSGAPFEAARSRIELARTLMALGRAPEAGREARTALTGLEALGARGESDRARRMVAQTESNGPAPVTGSSHSDGLTPREREVLALLASGMSNQEIADRLVLSIRTVQRHVENIYAKTGARGRAAAAVFATTHNIHA